MITWKQAGVFLVVAFVVAGLGVALFGNNRTGYILGPMAGLFAGLWAASRIDE